MLGYGLMDAWQPQADGAPVIRHRLHSRAFWVDVRMLEVGGAGSPRLTLRTAQVWGAGSAPFEALWGALEPFEGVVDELLASMPAFEP